MQKDFDDRRGIDERDCDRAKLRDKERAFSGFEGRFISISKKLMEDFQSARSVAHRGDRGAVREDLLRNFLKDEGYLPARYAVSKGSSHVVSTTGHSSEQIDLLIYDALDTPRLLDIGNVQYFPCEAVYGVIQVKSNLASVDDVDEALENIASFKRLSRVIPEGYDVPSSGFGILFAYDASLKWKTLYGCVERFVSDNPSAVWPNLLVIMQQGAIGNALNGRVVFSNNELMKISGAQLSPIPDTSQTLLRFYLILMDLLNGATLPPISLRGYASLPIAVGELWYRFVWMSSELGTCAKHGSYLREMPEEAVARVFEVCRAAPVVNVFEAIDEAYKTPGTIGESNEQQVEVRIYNPDRRPLADILIASPSGPLAFDVVEIQGVHCLVPHWYSIRERLIRECRECGVSD